MLHGEAFIEVDFFEFCSFCAKPTLRVAAGGSSRFEVELQCGHGRWFDGNLPLRYCVSQAFSGMTRVALALLVCTGFACRQSFEVASVKPSVPGSGGQQVRGGPESTSPGTVTLDVISLAQSTCW
jgi:hypothetical protein